MPADFEPKAQLEQIIKDHTGTRSSHLRTVVTGGPPNNIIHGVTRRHIKRRRSLLFRTGGLIVLPSIVYFRMSVSIGESPRAAVEAGGEINDLR